MALASHTVEFYPKEKRVGFTEDTSYVVAVGPSKPVIPIRCMPFDSGRCLELLERLCGSCLDDASRQGAQRALEELSAKVSEVLPVSEVPTQETCQIDLVLNADELGALPFEVCRGADGRYLFAGREPEIILTRRLRWDFRDRHPVWPSKPNVLFLHAASAANLAREVIAAHERALREAMRPWVDPSETEDGVVTKVFRRFGNPSVGDIQSLCAKARAKGTPYTHIHLLAHGEQVVDPLQPARSWWGLRLGSPDPIDPDALARAVNPQGGLPVVVTVAGCHTADQRNVFAQTASFAHELHKNGVPVVLASQLPLGKEGSVVLAEEFYGAIFEGVDVRVAVQRARRALYEGSGHDWVSLVAYVQLPEGYEDLRVKARVAAEQAKLEGVRACFKALGEKDAPPKEALHQYERDLRARINALDALGAEIEERGLPDALLQENLGNRASAGKSLYEAQFERSRAENDDMLRLGSLDTLRNSRDAYHRAWELNPLHHWTGAQFLCLEAVLDGRISKPQDWEAVEVLARRALLAELEKDVEERGDEWWWAYGTLAELDLLAVLADQECRQQGAAAFVCDLRAAVEADPIFRGQTTPFPILSTRRQFKRYTTWWTKANGFFVHRSRDLADEASSLLPLLEDG